MIYYWVPEDKDELSMPNAFILRRPIGEVTLDHIEKEFPLKGDLMFRFKYNHNGTTVWLDLSNKMCPVPKFENRIIMKVTRKTPKDTTAAVKESAG